MTLSEHFTLEELCSSGAASRLGLDNSPDENVVRNLYRVAAAMEQVRKLLGDEPIEVHSGYRSKRLNQAVGGVETSAHCGGLACDFVCPAFGAPGKVALAILASDIDYDQLILEYGWVHIGLADAGVISRHEALTKRSALARCEVGIRV